METIKLINGKQRAGQWFVEIQTNNDFHMYAITRTLYNGATRFQQVEIFETPQFGKMLVLDGDPQSLQSDESIYHEVLVHPVMLVHPNPERVLILGGGEGATIREVLKHKTVKEVVMVDLDKELVNICMKLLPEWNNGAFEDHRARILYEDALLYLKNNNIPFDVVISDLTEPLPETPTHLLYNNSFFNLLLSNLNNNGIFVMQASRITYGRNSLHLDHYSLLRQVFPIVRSFHIYIPSFFSDWGFLAASKILDPAILLSDKVNALLSERLQGSQLLSYDGEVHGGLFALPKDLRNDFTRAAGETVSLL